MREGGREDNTILKKLFSYEIVNMKKRFIVKHIFNFIFFTENSFVPDWLRAELEVK